MNFETYEIIQEELRQRKVNKVVRSILLDLCKLQLEGVPYVSQGDERFVVRGRKSEFEDIQGNQGVTSIKIEESLEDGNTEMSDGVSGELEPQSEGNEDTSKIIVSDENLDMIHRMFG